MYIPPLVALTYGVIGALGGAIYLSGRELGLTLSGTSAWVACIAPVLWLCAEALVAEGLIKQAYSRKVTYYSLIVGAAVIFFGAVLAGDA